MADLILACVHAGRHGDLPTPQTMRAVTARLRPSNMPPQPATITTADGLVLAVANESGGGVLRAPGAALLGATIGGHAQWDQVGAAPPDGSYALVRSSAASVEAIADATASRTLWYVFDDERLLVSTSQRALVALLGDFELDRRAVTWLLTNGTLGPDASWDRRIMRLHRDSRLHVDRDQWTLRVTTPPIVFAPVIRSRREHIALLREAVAWSCASLDIAADRWLLPLSGGMDSRTLAAFLTMSGVRPHSVTWTTRASLAKPLSDARVAKVVARRLGLPHTSRLIQADRDPAAALQRFIEVGEGRSDEIAGYVDGCALWRDFARRGVVGVIRGDEAFGARRRMADTASARWEVARDYPREHLINQLGLVDADWPRRLARRPDETLEQYVDRLTIENSNPTFLAALTEIKGRYLEIANPLLSRRIVDVVLTLPDELRLHARALHAVVDPVAWPVPYSRFPSVPPVRYLSEPAIAEAIVAELTGAAIGPVVSEEGAARLLVALASHPSQHRNRLTARDAVKAALTPASAVVPARLRARLAPPYRGPDDLPADMLSFRVAIASRSIALFQADAACGDGTRAHQTTRRHREAPCPTSS